MRIPEGHFGGNLGSFQGYFGVFVKVIKSHFEGTLGVTFENGFLNDF